MRDAVGAGFESHVGERADGYHVATSVHADTLDDVLHLYQHDLHLRNEDLRRLGLVVNIGLRQQGKAQYRRWLTTCFLRPAPDPRYPEAPIPLQLTRWNESDDTFEHADRSVLDELADWAGLAPQDFMAALIQRTDCLQELARGQGADLDKVHAAISDMRKLRDLTNLNNQNR